jgi:hypothetical protein
MMPTRTTADTTWVGRPDEPGRIATAGRDGPYLARGYGLSIAQHRFHPPRHLPLPRLKHMPVRARGQDDRRVPEELLHILEGEALRQGERRGRMTEVMEPAR